MPELSASATRYLHFPLVFVPQPDGLYLYRGLPASREFLTRCDSAESLWRYIHQFAAQEIDEYEARRAKEKSRVPAGLSIDFNL